MLPKLGMDPQSILARHGQEMPRTEVPPLLATPFLHKARKDVKEEGRCDVKEEGVSDVKEEGV